MLLGTIAFENVTRPWLWAIVIALGAGLLYVTYQGIFQRSQRNLSWGLMALRAVGLAALVLALARPTWTREDEQVDAGRLAVVVDSSVSMSLADSSGGSRYSLAKGAVEKLRTAVAQGSGPELQIELFDINGAPVEGALPAEPRVERTDLLRAVTETTARLRSKPLAGIVLLSDGMDNSGREGFQELADSGVPVYAAGFREDAESARLDLAVRRVTAPTKTMVNSEVKVEVLVAKSSGPAAKATVTLKRGREEFVAREVSLPADSSEQVVSLNLQPREAGRFVFTATLAGAAGERVLANNSQHFPLEVEAKPIRVFYLEGYLRNEYKFLKSRLENDPDVGLVSKVRQVNPDAVGENSGGKLLTAEFLKNFDVLILGDMESDYLAPAEYDAVVAWVDQGHALLVLGGYSSFGPKGFRSTSLAGALPIVFADKEPYQSEDPFVLELTPQGQSHPMFEISGDRVKDAALWSGTPPLSGASLVAREKPGADVLAVDPSFQIDGKPSVVVAAQRYGAGHTLVVAADTTWRWSRLPRVLGQADTLFAPFCSQTIRWLAGREDQSERPPLAVSTDRPDYEVSKPVTVRVLRQAPPGSDAAAGEVSAEITDEAGKTAPLEMRAGSADPDAFTGTFYPAAGGRYQVAATLAAGGKTVANQQTEFLVHGADLELAQTGTNRPQLQALATLTGGAYADIDKLEDLAANIPHTERRIARTERNEYGNSPWLFMFFLAAVTCEWVIRRRNHLV